LHSGIFFLTTTTSPAMRVENKNTRARRSNLPPESMLIIDFTTIKSLHQIK